MKKIAGSSKPAAKAKRKPRGKPLAKGYDPRRFTGGHAKDKESWSGVFTDLMNKNSEEITEMFGNNDIGRAYKILPKAVQMKYCVAARVLVALMFDPNSSLLNSVMDRTDGKVADTINLDGTINIDQYADLMDKIYGPKDTETPVS